MADEAEWERTKENGFAPDPKEVDRLFRVAQSKISGGEATGVFLLLCNGDGLVYQAEVLPRSLSSVAEAILCLEYAARELREEWEQHVIVSCDRSSPLQVVKDESEDADADSPS